MTRRPPLRRIRRAAVIAFCGLFAWWSAWLKTARSIELSAIGGSSGGAAHAMTVSVIVVLVITAACLPTLRLLPRRAPAEVTGE